MKLFMKDLNGLRFSTTADGPANSNVSDKYTNIYQLGYISDACGSHYNFDTFL